MFLKLNITFIKEADDIYVGLSRSILGEKQNCLPDTSPL